MKSMYQIKQIVFTVWNVTNLVQKPKEYNSTTGLCIQSISPKSKITFLVLITVFTQKLKLVSPTNNKISYNLLTVLIIATPNLTAHTHLDAIL